MQSSSTVNHNNRAGVARKSMKLSDYDCVGFDLDHTLAKYNLENLFRVCYSAMSEYLIREKGYPSDGFTFPGFNFCSRGLVLDLYRGNFLKVSDTGDILRASHGSRMMTNDEIVKEFGNERKWSEHHRLVNTVNNIDDRYRIFDNLFDMPTGIVCAHAIDCLHRKKGGLSQQDFNVWPDVVEAVNHAYHPKQFAADSGGFFSGIKKDPGHFVQECSEKLKSWLRSLKNANCRLFIITSSYVDFAKHSLQHILGNDWNSYFDAYVAFARKPSFFTLERSFMMLDSSGAEVPAGELTSGEFYLHGSSSQFYEFLKKLSGKDKPKVCYVGDSMRSDVFPAKTVQGWDTVLVLDELECDDCIVISSMLNNQGRLSKVNNQDKCGSDHGQSDGEPTSKKFKKSSSDDDTLSRDAEENDNAHFLTTSIWGSMFTEEKPFKDCDFAKSQAEETLGDADKQIVNTLWAHIIYKYTDIAVPNIDCLPDLEGSVDTFNHDITPGNLLTSSAGFCGRVPRVLGLNAHDKSVDKNVTS